MMKSTLRGMSNKDLKRMTGVNLHKCDRDEMVGIRQMMGEIERRRARREKRMS